MDKDELWENYKELLNAGLAELLSENLEIDISISPEYYSDGELFNVRVRLEYDGMEISSMSDSIHVPR